MRLLGTFRVFVGSRTVEASGWRLKKAAGLVKLLALAPDHRLHREQVTEALWPSQGRRMASNSFRQVSTSRAGRWTRTPPLLPACWTTGKNT
jgi:DNA-binding SARP family transcriptional activator